MRIRLLIERNELPSVSVLWSFTPTQLNTTVAQFLENVNVRFPLEGNTWGLEDYTVSLAGYEAQHYTKVGEVFKEDDEVVIKPLLFAEVRARTIGGRAQITSDGRRLVDGVPFGKPLLKRMRRPDVDIPPARKRARLQVQDDNAGAVVRFEEVEAEDDEDDGEDGDFEDAEDDESEDDESEGEGGADANLRNQESDAEDEQDEDEQDSEDSDSSNSSSGSGSGPDQESSGRRREEIKSGNQEPGLDLDRSENDSANKSDSDTTSSASNSDSKEQDSEESEEQDSEDSEEDEHSDSSSDSSDSNTIEESKPTASTSAQHPPLPIPHEGKLRTKERNLRRRQSARLKHLKNSGVLPPNTTLAQMAEYEKTGKLPPMNEAQKARVTELHEQHLKLLSNIDAGGIDVTSEAKNSLPAAHTPASTESPFGRSAARSAAKAVAKRVNPAARMIYSTLGLRVPESESDKQALRQKLADRSKKPAKQVVAEKHASEDDNPDWRDQVDISAIELLDEGVTLIAPPFPFSQKWDPQYWWKNVKRKAADGGGEGQGYGQKSRKMHGGRHVETYDKYNQYSGSDALNYDDVAQQNGGSKDYVEAEWNDGSKWEDGALLGAEQDDNDGFPSLPADISTLPALAEADVKDGDFVVFTEMACSEATGWQPEMVMKVAHIERRVGSLFNVTFSTRGGKKYDEQGNRVYGMFEMEGYEEEVEKQMSWAEMMEPKLLFRRSATV